MKMARFRMPKNEYDQLYYYVSDIAMGRIAKGEDPLRFTSPRRYETLEEARKAALAKSKKEWSILHSNEGIWPNLPGHSLNQHIFKGREYIGSVGYNALKGMDGGAHDNYDGTWLPTEDGEPYPIIQDGTSGTKPKRSKNIRAERKYVERRERFGLRWFRWQRIQAIGLQKPPRV